MPLRGGGNFSVFISWVGFSLQPAVRTLKRLGKLKTYPTRNTNRDDLLPTGDRSRPSFHHSSFALPRRKTKEPLRRPRADRHPIGRPAPRAVAIEGSGGNVKRTGS